MKRTTAQARTVAKGHGHVKPAAARHKAATGHAHKHHKAAKHHAAAKKHKGTVHRGLAIGDAVACCAAEALAASLRLSGLPVSDADVLSLYWRTADDPDAGASIEETLGAASAFGLAGLRPVTLGANFGISVDPSDPTGQLLRQFGHRLHAHGLILGVDLPEGPHTVLATPDGWWSWGELWCPWCEWPDAVIEEAWVVAWP
jgi:hypothetical protein